MCVGIYEVIRIQAPHFREPTTAFSEILLAYSNDSVSLQELPQTSRLLLSDIVWTPLRAQDYDWFKTAAVLQT